MSVRASISVVIPCYNAAPYLAQTIGSVLEQTHAPSEVIVVDDGSTDDSLTIARRFEPDGVRVFSRRSGNAAHTRNLGASVATGDALMFLDADDVLAADALEGLADALGEAQDGIAICRWYRLDQAADGRWLQRPPSCAPRRPGEDTLAAWLTGWYHPPCSVLWSRAAYERVGGWDPHAAPNDDGDILMRSLVRQQPLVEARSGSAFYRRLGSASLSGTRFTRAGLQGRLWVIRKIAAQLEERGLLAAYRVALGQACLTVASDTGEYRDLRDEAVALGRTLAGSYRGRIAAWWRHGQPARRRLMKSLGRRLVPWSQRTRLAPIRMSDGADEVRFGLGRAGAALERAATVPAAGRMEAQGRAPSVSVIVPTYNRAHLLPAAIGSVLSQTFTDFELLVVDDGSRDDTAVVVGGYSDTRVRYLAQPRNGGVSAARNRGLREARGRFIAFLDSDDAWFPQKLARQVDQMADLPATVGLVYCGAEIDPGDGTHRTYTPAHRGDVYHQLLMANVIHGTSGVMLRQDVVATAGFFDEGIPAIEDYEYWTRIARFFAVDCIEEPLFRYHDTSGLERKSLNIGENLAARAWFYHKHGAEMRRLGVAHHFLLTSAKRHLAPSWHDPLGAFWLALRAAWLAPLWPRTYRMLGRTLAALVRTVSASARPARGHQSARRASDAQG